MQEDKLYLYSFTSLLLFKHHNFPLYNGHRIPSPGAVNEVGPVFRTVLTSGRPTAFVPTIAMLDSTLKDRNRKPSDLMVE